MPTTISVKREFELIATDAGGNPCIFPRDPANPIFVNAFDFKTKIVDDTQPTRYLAFPFVVKIGASLVGIFSESDSHASGSSQYMIRSDDDGKTWSQVLFFDAAVAGVYNTTLLTSLLAVGDSVVLKVWTIKNVAGTLTVTVQSTATFGGNTYALWSKAIPGAGGNLWRTGYGLVAGVNQTALFQSTDGGVTWTGVSVMFADAAKTFNEADIVNLNGTSWLSLAREDLSSSVYNSVYYSTSVDDGVTWAAAILLTQTKVNGRQPNLIKTTNGNIVFSSSDRKTGSTGYASNGLIIPYVYDTTGITVYGKPLVLLGANPMLTFGAPGTTVIRVTQSGHGYTTGDVVFIYGAVGFDGVPTAELNGLKTITVVSTSIYSFTTTTGATAGSVLGGGSVVNVYNITQWGFRTRIAGMYSSDGGQPYSNEISTANNVNTVFYHRRAIDENPIIASATFYAPNL
jgi:hypothetical protein